MDVDETVRDARHEAAIKAIVQKNNGFFAFLWKEGKMTPEEKNELLEIAVRQGNAPIVKLILTDDQVNLSVNDNAALMNALYYEYDDIVQMLLDDERVDWNEFADSEKLSALLQARRDRIEREVAKKELVLARRLYDTTRGGIGWEVAKKFGLDMTLQAKAEELCAAIKSGAISSVELVQLGRLLKVDLSGVRSKREACDLLFDALTR